MKFLLKSAVFLTLGLPAAFAADHKVPPVQPATEFAAVETHKDEKVSIAVEPYDTREKTSIFRIDYLAHGVMPIRLIVTNNGDTPISLREARILFETPDGERINAAEPEDVERLMTRRQREGSKIPLPMPLPPIHTKGKGNYKDIEADFNTFEYSALTVEAHCTRAGFLFYDVNGLGDPLKGSSMLIRKILNAEGQELFYFEIPFEKYLRSKSSQMD